MPDLRTLGPKLAKLIPRLASDHDGEVVATVAAIRRTLQAGGADLHDFAGAVQTIGLPAVKAAPKRRKASTKAKAQPPAPRRYSAPVIRSWAQLAPDERLDLLRRLIRSGLLTPWETMMCTDIGIMIRDRPHITQSERQQAVLDRLAAKFSEQQGARR